MYSTDLSKGTSVTLLSIHRTSQPGCMAMGLLRHCWTSFHLTMDVCDVTCTNYRVDHAVATIESRAGASEPFRRRVIADTF